MTSATEILAAALEMEPANVSADASMENSDRWDSLAHIRLIALVEETLGHPLDSEEMLSITSLDNLQAVIEKG